MELALLIFRLFLAAIFGVAGIAKLADPVGSRKAFAGFGVPASPSTVAVILLPIVEITIAIGFLFPVSSWYAAIGAVALLTVFVAGMIFQLARGKAPDCHCFGQIHSGPVGVSSLIRNVVFLVPAIVLITKGRGEQGLSLTNIDRDAMQILLGLIAVFLLGFSVDYLRRILAKQDEVIRRIDILELVAKDGGSVEREEAGSPHDGMPIGAVLPVFALLDLDGAVVSTHDIGSSGVPSLLFFVSPSCIPCKALIPQIASWKDHLSEKVNVVLISSGTALENLEKFGFAGLDNIFLQNEREFADAVNARWTPSALFVDARGRIASHVAAGDTAIEELIGKIKSSSLDDEFIHFTVANSSGSHSGHAIGDSIPDFEVAALNGEMVRSSDLRSKQTLVTFWSTTCPYCVEMVAELKAWDLSKGADALNLVIFSDGDEGQNRALGFESPVIIDKGYKVAEKLGMHGTPSAILVNEDGRFASEIAMGANHIWALVGKSN